MISFLSKFRDYYYLLYPGEHHEYKCELNEVTFLYSTNRKDDLFRAAKKNKLLSFEPKSLQIWQARCSNGGIAVDIGAYTGIYTVTAILSGADKIYSFEPNLEISDFFIKNVTKNLVADKVIFRNIALGSVVGVGNLLAPKNRIHKSGNYTGSGVQLSTAINNRDLTLWQKLVQTEISTLDLEISQKDQTNIKVIKIDVEGFEIEVLRGAKRILSKNSPTVIVEALTQSNRDEISFFMSELNYSLIHSAEKNLIFSKS
jgi:FkbM family methyltransferase